MRRATWWTSRSASGFHLFRAEKSWMGVRFDDQKDADEDAPVSFRLERVRVGQKRLDAGARSGLIGELVIPIVPF